MRIKPDLFFAAAVASPALRKMLAHADLIVSPKDLNNMLHKSQSPNQEVDISIIRKPDLVAMLREVRDHRDIQVYRNADIDLGFMSHSQLRNYQTFVSLQKIGSIYQLNAFFADHGFSGGLAAASEALLIRARIESREYAAFYVPPIIEYQNKSKIHPPMKRLEDRAAAGGPTVILPGFANNGDLKLSPILEDWRHILSSSQTTVPILKDGTHRSYATNLAGAPMRAIIINESESLVQSVPLRTEMLIVTDGKPKERTDRFLGMLELKPNRWEGWVDLASIGIDG